MARLEYFIVCRAVSIDIDTDEITLSQVVEDVFVEEFPQHLPKITAVSSWELAENELETDFQALLQVTIPGSSSAQSFPMNFRRGSRRYRAMQGILEIPLHTSGDLKVDVLLNGSHAASHIVAIHPAGTGGFESLGSKLS